MPTAKAFAAQSATSPLAPWSFDRRAVGPKDIQIQIQYCGVCHSDLHMARNEWKFTAYPIVPGHEIVGVVTSVGDQVKGFKVGERAAVGCMVDSCRTCADCKVDLEQYCQKGSTFTYNAPDPHTGGMTYGGYSDHIVVDEAFVLRVPKNLDLAGAAPLLCAGITTWSPLRHWDAGPGKKVGIVGLGGLGHMGLKFSHALGAETVLFTTSPGKAEDAKRLGADSVVISRDEAQMAKHTRSCDFILNTVAASHNLDAYVELLKRDGTMCLVGVPDQPHPSPSLMPMIMGRRSLAGSLIGGIRETQEMLDFCGTHNIVSEVEIIPIQQINAAYERMLKSDVKYRFVIDMNSLGGGSPTTRKD